MYRFLVRNRGEVLKPRPRSAFALTTDNWDDFGHKVQFHLAFFDDEGSESRIGTLKILKRSASDSSEVALRTRLESTFHELGEEYISLGQEDGYYKHLHSRFGKDAGEVLVALRDIAWQPALAIPFETTTAFRNALMRENGAYRARRFGREWASGRSVQESPAFHYICEIEGAEGPVEARIPFDEKDRIPGRIVAIIGRNAVGKTKFLARLAEDLAQISRASAERLSERESRFPEGRPLYTRVLAISYSAFDRFKRPPPRDSSSYVYCGIRNEKGVLSRSSLIESYKQNQRRIRELGRQSEWARHMRTVLGEHGEAIEQRLVREISADQADEENLALLSSGQAILCHFTTALLAWLQPNSLVLFDEPETHLHPNAVASLFLVLSDILATYDSYAILATHSPVVIQEVPSKRVLVFQRTGNVTSAEPLGLESFGESVSELTRHVFETIEVESLYRRTLQALAEREKPKEVLARFPHGLSLSAQAYLLAQYAKRRTNER